MPGIAEAEKRSSYTLISEFRIGDFLFPRRAIVMKVFYHEEFHQVYVSDPAAAPGRIEAILAQIKEEVTFEEILYAGADDIEAIHSSYHINYVTRQGLYNISALAAGGAIQAAVSGLTEPSFALIRPPGHHASADSCWGFCYFNNMAIALDHLKRNGLINRAYVLDFDLHYGDGNVNILGEKGYVTILNPVSHDRKAYLAEVEADLTAAAVDIIGVSAGFDNHVQDWGGLLETEDYQTMGRMVLEASRRMGAGCFGILEGGYNHQVLGLNVRAFLRGLRGV
jgi:acetoin utilization deacetylase AcuC-like enzyme